MESVLKICHQFDFCFVFFRHAVIDCFTKRVLFTHILVDAIMRKTMLVMTLWENKNLTSVRNKTKVRYFNSITFRVLAVCVCVWGGGGGGVQGQIGEEGCVGADPERGRVVPCAKANPGGRIVRGQIWGKGWAVCWKCSINSLFHNPSFETFSDFPRFL